MARETSSSFLKNLINSAQDYTQYKSVSHKHASDTTTFSCSGTNGFTSTMDVASKPSLLRIPGIETRLPRTMVFRVS